MLTIARDLGQARTAGAFIDQAMTVLADRTGSGLVSFNKVDTGARTGTVAFRPYRGELATAVGNVSRLLDEHPLFRWYTSQPDWTPRRISDVMPWPQFRLTRLCREVLEPIGACHLIVIMLTPVTADKWVYFAVNRADRDFTDADLELCTGLQPALIALYAHLTVSDSAPCDPPVTLTRQEKTVVRYLAEGLSAAAIGHRLPASTATVRKHLQHIYAKLGVADRMEAVRRARDLGLLAAEDTSGQFRWDVRLDPPHTF